MMLPLFIALGLLIVGTLLLLLGADWFLDGAGDLARALGMSALVLGVILAGLEPEEMLTAAIASARGAPTLAVGNVIGTNVTIVTAALGLSALITPMVIDRSVRRQALIATLVSIIPIVLLDSLHSSGPPCNLHCFTVHGGCPPPALDPCLVWEDTPCDGWSPRGSVRSLSHRSGSRLGRRLLQGAKRTPNSTSLLLMPYTRVSEDAANKS